MSFVTFTPGNTQMDKYVPGPNKYLHVYKLITTYSPVNNDEPLAQESPSMHLNREYFEYKQDELLLCKPARILCWIFYTMKI